MLDNKESKEGKGKEEDGVERRRLRVKARINGSLVNEGRLGPWKYQEEMILDEG